jgi:Domain of unknown function (DUF4349)
MSESTSRRSLSRRILFGIGAFGIFTLLFMIAIRMAVTGIYRGIEANKATGLSAISPFGTDNLAVSDLRSFGNDWISRSAALELRTNAFESSLKSLNQIVSTHHGNLEDLKTQSLSGYGRTLSAHIAVPSGEFEATLSDLKALGRIDSIAEAGEDSAVKIAAASRHLIAAQTNLSRLQKLQRDRKGELRDVVALEKDISQANESVVEAERQNQGLVSIVAQAHIRLTLLEDYRAPLQTNLAGVTLQLRNSLVEGIGSIFSSAALVLGIFFEFGLPLLFWVPLLFLPARLAWRRFRRLPAPLPATP